MTTVVISQPMYFPWAGFLDLMRHADVLIWLDDVQFSKGSFTNRVQVKLPSGTPWMTVPLEGKGTGQKIADLRAAGDGWISSHRAMLTQSLAKYPFAQRALDVFDAATCPALRLNETLIRSAELLLEALDVRLPPRHRASEMGVQDSSWQRVLNLVKAAGGTRYLSAAGGAHYIHHGAFDAAGIAVVYADYAFTPWPQGHGSFTPFVTGLDLLASRGREATRHLDARLVPWADYLPMKGIVPQ